MINRFSEFITIRILLLIVQIICAIVVMICYTKGTEYEYIYNPLRWIVIFVPTVIIITSNTKICNIPLKELFKKIKNG